MTEFSGLDANVALVNFLVQHGSELPDHIREPIQAAVAAPDGLSALITGIEGLYAARADLGAEGRELLLDLVRFVTARGFYGYNRAGGRGFALLSVAERMASGGEAVVEPVLDGDEIVAPGDLEHEDRFTEPPPPSPPPPAPSEGP